MPALRVLIVADDPLARAGLATLLTPQPGCIVAGQMAAHADVLAELHDALCDLIGMQLFIVGML